MSPILSSVMSGFLVLADISDREVHLVRVLLQW